MREAGVRNPASTAGSILGFAQHPGTRSSGQLWTVSSTEFAVPTKLFYGNRIRYIIIWRQLPCAIYFSTSLLNSFQGSTVKATFLQALPAIQHHGCQNKLSRFRTQWVPHPHMRYPHRLGTMVQYDGPTNMPVSNQLQVTDSSSLLSRSISDRYVELKTDKVRSAIPLRPSQGEGRS
jgi:hypothetical protein